MGSNRICHLGRPEQRRRNALAIGFATRRPVFVLSAEFVLAVFLLFNLPTLTRRVGGLRSRSLVSASRAGRWAAHPARASHDTHFPFGPRYPGPPRSPQVGSAREVAATRATKAAIDIR